MTPSRHSQSLDDGELTLKRRDLRRHERVWHACALVDDQKARMAITTIGWDALLLHTLKEWIA